MIGILTTIAVLATSIIVKKLDDSSDYKEPKGKHKNRYK